MNLEDRLASESEVPEAMIEGYRILVSKVEELLHDLPEDALIGNRHLKFGLPTVYSWTGRDALKVSDMPDILHGGADKGVYGMLDLGTRSSMAYDIIASISDGYMISDSWIEEHGADLVDNTVPGIALFIGEPDEMSLDEIDYCENKGMTIILSGGYADLETESDVLRLHGMSVLGVNSLLSRIALIYGKIEPGSRTSLAKYLRKRPRLITMHTGRLTVFDVVTIFSAAAVGSFTVSDSVFPTIPRISDRFSENMSARAMAERGITFDKNRRVRSGSTFENRRIRKADTYFEFGGTDTTASYEIVLSSDDVEDGSVFIDGEEMHKLKRGEYPLSIEVVVSDNVDPGMEQAIERRIHFALSRTEGVWHSGQRNNAWIRISVDAVEKGIRFKDLGENIISDIRENFGNVAKGVEVRFSITPSFVSSGLEKARANYRKRDSLLKDITDDEVEVFFTCTMCQTYAPGHICIITPERPSVCGSVTWADAKVGSEIDPYGHQRPFFKGELIDEAKGIWKGVDDMVRKASMGSISGVYIHSVVDSPMTACSCMEVVAAISDDRRSILLVDRSDNGENPSGMSFSELSSLVGRGAQIPGYMGIGRHYILSPGFLKGDGGLRRVSWISSRLKSILGESLRNACEETGVKDLFDKIGDENCVSDAASLEHWMLEKDHPALHLELLRL